MLGSAELPIAILAWTLVGVIYGTTLGGIVAWIIFGWEKISFSREKKRRDKIRERAKQNILVINKGESSNEEVKS